MGSHHFIGSGDLSAELRRAVAAPASLLERVGERVDACSLEVVATQTAPFSDGGLTLVWILAESHLVLHVWAAEGFATLDLHVCDYRGSNAAASRRLVAMLDTLCFAADTGSWRELHLERPGAPVAAARLGG